MRPYTLLLFLLLLGPTGAHALSVTVSGPTAGPLVAGVGTERVGGVAQITFAVGLDTATPIQGYDLSISWDATELQLVAARGVWPGFAFTPPSALQSGGARVADLNLAPTAATTLFEVTFNVLGSLVADGQADFSAFVDPARNGTGITPGGLDNPAGAGVDVVPEPGLLALLALGATGCRCARRRTL